MQNSDEHRGDRRTGEDRRRSHFRGNRTPMTVRTDPEHHDAFSAVAKLFGLSFNDFIALVLAEVFGLSRPTKVPAVPIAVHRFPEIVQAIQDGVDQRELAALVQDVQREALAQAEQHEEVLPKSA
jgi:hypothetical protein